MVEGTQPVPAQRHDCPQPVGRRTPARVRLLDGAALVSAALFMAACESPSYPTNLWDDAPAPVETPEITGLLPAAGTLSGVGIITISGSGFANFADSNLVYIGGLPARVLTATEEELAVQATDVAGDSLTVTVTVMGAWGFAVWDGYRLEEAVSDYGGFGLTDDKDAEEASGLAVDLQENLYVSVKLGGVIQVTPDGERSLYATTTVLQFNALRTGPGGVIYAVAGRTSLYQIPAGGGQAQVIASIPERLFGLDFDEAGNLYLGGRGARLFRMTPTGEVTQVATYGADIQVQAVRVFDGQVYVAGEYKGADTSAVQAGIWRSAIIPGGDTLDTPELVYDWGDFTGPGGGDVQDITFAADGELYISSDADVGIYVLAPPYTDEHPEQLYPDVSALEAPISTILWGNGRYLYVSHPSADEEKRSLKRVALIKDGASYYGRQ